MWYFHGTHPWKCLCANVYPLPDFDSLWTYIWTQKLITKPQAMTWQPCCFLITQATHVNLPNLANCFHYTYQASSLSFYFYKQNTIKERNNCIQEKEMEAKSVVSSATLTSSSLLPVLCPQHLNKRSLFLSLSFLFLCFCLFTGPKGSFIECRGPFLFPLAVNPQRCSVAINHKSLSFWYVRSTIVKKMKTNKDLMGIH